MAEPKGLFVCKKVTSSKQVNLFLRSVCFCRLSIGDINSRMLIAGSHKDVGIDYVQAQVDGRVSGGDECRTYHDKCPHSVFEVSECAGIWCTLFFLLFLERLSIRFGQMDFCYNSHCSNEVFR